jgi:hypothetical protein
MKDVAIIVLHGFLMKKIVMSPLCKRLSVITPNVYNYEYNTRKIDIEKIQADLFAISKGYQSVFFVAHSLGGIIVREATKDGTFTNIKGIFTLGTPHRGSSLARLTKRVSGNLILGDAAKIGLVENAINRWENKANLHCISGSNSFGLIRFIPKYMRPLDFIESDGTVTLFESQLPNATSYKIFPQNHTSMIYSKAVAKFIENTIIKAI